jgi:hypothetical protein
MNVFFTCKNTLVIMLQLYRWPDSLITRIWPSGHDCLCSGYIESSSGSIQRSRRVLIGQTPHARRRVRVQHKRLRWSRDSVLAFSTQVRGFKPGWSRRIFKGVKILSTPSFGGEVKPSVSCRRFVAYKRTLNVPWKSCI